MKLLLSEIIIESLQRPKLIKLKAKDNLIFDFNDINYLKNIIIILNIINYNFKYNISGFNWSGFDESNFNECKG